MGSEVIYLDNFVKGATYIIMAGIYDGQRGEIVGSITPTAFEIKLRSGLTVVAGREFFKIIGVDDGV